VVVPIPGRHLLACSPLDDPPADDPPLDEPPPDDPPVVDAALVVPPFEADPVVPAPAVVVGVPVVWPLVAVTSGACGVLHADARKSRPMRGARRRMR